MQGRVFVVPRCEQPTNQPVHRLRAAASAGSAAAAAVGAAGAAARGDPQREVRASPRLATTSSAAHHPRTAHPSSLQVTLSLVLPKTGCAKVSVGAPNPCDNAALQAEVVRILETERRALRVGASFKASDVSTTLNSIPDAEGGGKTFAVTVAAEDEAAAEQILAALAKLMGTPDAAADNLQIVVDEVGAAPSVTTLVLLAPPSPPPAPHPPPAEEGEVNCSAPDTPANATGCEPDVTPEWLYQMAIETLSFGGFIGAAVGAGVLLLCICCCCVCLCRRKCCKKKGKKMASAEYYTASSDLTKSKQGKNSLIAFDSIFSAGGGGGQKHGGGAARRNTRSI